MPVYPLLAIGFPLLLAVIAFVYFRVTLDGPNATICVVDRRTMRLAQRRVAEATEAGAYVRAFGGATALLNWLNREIKTGPARYRAEYVALRERWELRQAELREQLGLPEVPV